MRTTIKNAAITKLLIAVATVESRLSSPIFPKIATNEAKTADKPAYNSHLLSTTKGTIPVFFRQSVGLRNEFS